MVFSGGSFEFPTVSLVDVVAGAGRCSAGLRGAVQRSGSINFGLEFGVGC